MFNVTSQRKPAFVIQLKSPGLAPKKNERNSRLTDALYPAGVLAELGDPRGYELAARMALEGELNQRKRAALVLIEIAKLDAALLAKKGMDPGFVLRAMAESEKNPRVLWMVMTVRKLENHIAVQVLEALRDSPNASELHRRAAARSLRKIRGERERLNK